MRSIVPLTLAASLCWTGTLSAQPVEAESAAVAAVGPKLQIMPEEIDFGQIDDSKVVEQTVQITNVGDETFRIPEIEGVRASCGCTVPKLSKYVLEPGESVELLVQFNPTNRSGNQKKTVTIMSGHSEATTTIPVSAYVIQRVQLVEGLVQFGNIDFGETASVRVRVRGMTPEFQVTEAVPSRDDIFAAKVISTEVVGRPDPVTGEEIQVGESTIEVTVLPDAPGGRTDGKLTIKTNDPVADEKEARMVVNVVPDVRVDPAVVRIGAVEAGSSFEHAITVYSNKGTPFDISQVLFVTNDLNDDDKARITTSHEPITAEDGRTGYVVTLKGDVSETMRIIRGRLVMVTDAPGQRIISANVSGVVRQR